MAGEVLVVWEYKGQATTCICAWFMTVTSVVWTPRYDALSFEIYPHMYLYSFIAFSFLQAIWAVFH